MDPQPVYLVLTPTQLDVLRVGAGILVLVVVAAFFAAFGPKGPRV